MMISIVDDFQSVPRFSKALALTLIVLYACNVLFGERADQFLALYAGYTFGVRFCLWNVFTSAFYSSNAASALLGATSSLAAGRYFEPIWGSMEFAKFVAITALGSGVLCYASVLAVYAATLNETVMYNSYWCGFDGVVGAFLVALKQLTPESPVAACGVSSGARLKHAPFAFVCVAVVLRCVLMSDCRSLPFVVYGALVAWLYLRFYQPQRHVDAALVGDLGNPDFTFASFFPDIVQPPIAIVANTIYRVVAPCCCRNRSVILPVTADEQRHGDGGSSRYSYAANPAKGRTLSKTSASSAAPFDRSSSPASAAAGMLGSPSDTQRWRARAQRELEERLAQLAAENDDLEGDGDDQDDDDLLLISDDDGDDDDVVVDVDHDESAVEA
jgi:membrane associated rhomboid family serine protease